MGLDLTTLEALLYSLQFVKNKNNALTLGRQAIHINYENCLPICSKYAIECTSDIYHFNNYSEGLLKNIGFKIVDSIDNSPYEEATIIKDFNESLYLMEVQLNTYSIYHKHYRMLSICLKLMVFFAL
jgi:hypothetical protein